MESKCTRIAASEIHIAGDILPNNTEVEELAMSIKTLGLMYPIAVMVRDEGGYVVIIGEGRYLALKSLGVTSIPVEVLTMDEAGEALTQEISVRELAGDITLPQRLSYANRIEVVEKKKASFRKRLGRSLAVMSCESAPDDNGKVQLRDVVARKAGFTSTTQMRRAMDIVKNRPDLLEAIDRGEYTIYGAHNEMKRAGLKSAMQAEASASAGPVMSSGSAVGAGATSGTSKADGSGVTDIDGHSQPADDADYLSLHAEYTASMRELRKTCNALCDRCEEYEKRLRDYKENAERARNEQRELVRAMQRSVFGDENAN